MNAKNAKQGSETKISSSTMYNPSSELADHLKASGNWPLVSSVPSTVGRYSALPVTPPSQLAKTSFGEQAANEYATKASKMRPTLLPVEVVEQGTLAMEFGAAKYGIDQWRTVEMTEREFVDALERHLIAYKKGETYAPDSKVTHLGHIIANCGILLAKYGDKQ